jgi:glyoxylase-like metal-dependent hydrolase (beta-lactamase superfamily II)
MTATYEVLAVRYGTLATTKAHLYYRYEAYGQPDAPQSLDYFFYLLRGDGRTIVVDTGFDPAVGARRGRTCLCEPAQALARLGVDAGEVEQVVITHLHYDHVGNLGLFPRAQLLVPERELEFWTGPWARRPQFAEHVEAREIEAIAAARQEGRVRTYAGPAELAPGVQAVDVGGHSPGQHALVVARAGGPVVLASDAIHLYEELERDRPFAVFADLAGMYRGYDTLRELSSGPGAALVPGHDPEVAMRFPTYDGDGLAVVLA